jgi:uncharacterized membrane protein YdjX (TVP38/TMEM64 family)
VLLRTEIKNRYKTNQPWLKPVLAVLVLTVFVTVFVIIDSSALLSLATLKAQHASLLAYREAHFLATGVGYFCLYVLVTGLSLPGAAVLTLVGGLLFGLHWGTLLVSFASSVGATLAFLMSRWFFQALVVRRFAKYFQIINDGVAQQGARYLFSLRLAPIMPFVMINIVMGVTNMRVWTFYWVSQLGMLPATLVYINAGTQLAQLRQLSDVLSVRVWGAFLVVALLPWFISLGGRFFERKKSA